MQTLTEKEQGHSDVSSLGTTPSFELAAEYHENGHINAPRAVRLEKPELAAGGSNSDVEGQVQNLNVEPLTPPPVKVPRSKRRGLLGQFTILAEVEQPKNYPRRIKWFITFIVALAAIAAPLGTTIFFRK